MKARIRYTAFKSRTSPELDGRITWISPDQSLAPKYNNESYFKVRVGLEPGEVERLGEKIEPGMPADVMMTSEARSVISYLINPMSDQVNQAFRERQAANFQA